jgi:hypothetical protein
MVKMPEKSLGSTGCAACAIAFDDKAMNAVSMNADRT